MESGGPGGVDKPQLQHVQQVDLIFASIRSELHGDQLLQRHGSKLLKSLKGFNAGGSCGIPSADNLVREDQMHSVSDPALVTI